MSTQRNTTISDKPKSIGQVKTVIFEALAIQNGDGKHIIFIPALLIGVILFWIICFIIHSF